MSDNKKKALLNEASTKRFWKLAGLKPIHEKAYLFEEEEELEEMRAAKEDEKEEVDEGMRAAKEDEEERGVKEEVEDLEESDLEERGMPMRGMPMAAEDEPEMDMGDEEGPEDGQDVEVDVPEGDVASLRTARDILDQILAAVDGGDAEPEMDAEEPEMDAEEPALEEADDEELNEVDQEELEEVAERIATRVAKRIAESLKRK